MKTPHHNNAEQEGVATAIPDNRPVQRVRETPASNLFGDQFDLFDQIRLTPPTTHQRNTPWACQQQPRRLNRVKASQTNTRVETHEPAETNTHVETHGPRILLTYNEFKQWKAFRNAE